MKKITILLWLTLLCPLYSDEKIYKSATEFDYPPFSVTSSGYADGFSVDLLEAVANVMNLKIDFKIDQWEIIKNKLIEGKLDVLPLVGRTDERERDFDFTIPYIVMNGNIFIRNNNDSIKTELDLQGKEIIVMEGDNSHEYALKMNFTDTLILTKTYSDAFKLLNSGKHDAILAQGIVGMKIISDLKLKDIKPLSQIDRDSLSPSKINLSGFEQKFCFAVKEGDKELLSKLNEGLIIIYNNGSYNKIFDKWFPFLKDNRISPLQFFYYLIGIVIPLIIILLLFALIYTKNEIIKKTHALVNEISQKEIIQNELIRAKEIAEKNSKAKSEFLSNISHELRTPLNGILGFTDILYEQENDPSKKEYLKIVKSSGDHLLTIINDVLDLSKIEAGMLKISYKEFDIKTLLNWLSSLFQESFKINNNTFKIINNSQSEILIGDELRVKQILTNLISNSNKFTTNGTICIEINDYKLETGCTHISFKITDTGIGINKEKMNHLFEMFNQGEEHLTKKYGGTGIGLAIVNKLTLLLNGTISVSSVPDKGSVFEIIIPFKTPPASKINRIYSEKKIRNYDFSDKYILIAEDSEINIKLLEILLSETGILYDIAYNGEEVLEKIKTQKYDLILMDSQMPKLNGIEASKIIKNSNDEGKSKTIIIAVSAYALNNNIENATLFGSDDYLSKPFSKEQLFFMLEKWLK
ncbi:MAG: hypothetical protein A2015_15965 [Spirochaetes bacterium GWF1_31_7]|nr:MAG: hypothetical protein A2Y30_13340 [Spirochaetes bacterium GWE1_32_154]OHD49950.1 MAG: hypothetical protein A2Y29_11385 [Spirochaetes bacterium GWE2_31_10]OHD52267.1 MAG: hypothetical protein A2015_15965 [Spirochaetes bacterium GWF1_31_7]OHD72993.1 MAG: hypothetical protein A2355_07110 [Spirochaetes bacterium RIFOXYB1_FULL_32_8]HBI38409.1 hypothetical protein [Spirochaetia bacterium]